MMPEGLGVSCHAGLGLPVLMLYGGCPWAMMSAEGEGSCASASAGPWVTVPLSPKLGMMMSSRGQARVWAGAGVRLLRVRLWHGCLWGCPGPPPEGEGQGSDGYLGDCAGPPT